MTHVGEEGGFRPVQLGQRLGAHPLFFVGAGVRKRIRRPARQQFEKRSVVLIKRQPWTGPDDEKSAGYRVPGLRQRHHRGRRRRLRPPAPGQAEFRIDVLQDLHAFVHGLPQRPYVGIARVAMADQRYFGRSPSNVMKVPAARREPRGGAVQGIQIDQGERHISVMLGERASGNIGRCLFRTCVSRGGGEMAKSCEPPFSQYFLRVLGAGAEKAADAAFICRKGAERKREVRLFGIPITIHDHLALIVP